MGVKKEVKKRLTSKISCLILLVSFYFINGFAGQYNYCLASSGSESAAPGKYNIILILFDSIRADHLGCYGYKRNISPSIDKLAKEGVLFEQPICQSTWSLPSQCSILTSKYVPSHGVDDIYKRLSDSELTLAEILKMYGYETAAFTGGFWLSSVFNSGQGFDLYFDGLTFGKMRETVPLALDWLRNNKDKRFFLLLQGFDGHSPFNLPKEYEEKFVDHAYNGIFKTLTLDHNIGDRLSGDEFFLDYNYDKKVRVTQEDIQYIIDNYDGSIACSDKYIGDFLQKIDELGLKDNTIIILTSYHGTPLFEHGIILRRQHGGVTDGTIRVPLIIRHPQKGRAGIRIASQVQLIDIMPTILDFNGIPVNHQSQGKSLSQLFEKRSAFSFDEYAFVNGYNEVAVRTNTWKLIKRSKKSGQESLELYNLKNDPAEMKDLINSKKDAAVNFEHKLDEWFKLTQPDSQKISPVADSEINKIKEEMKKAGYWFVHDNGDKEVIGRDIPGEKKDVQTEGKD